MIIVALICLGVPLVLLGLLYLLTPDETKGSAIALFAITALGAIIFSAMYGSQNGGGHLPQLVGPITFFLFGVAWLLLASATWSIFHLVASLRKKEVAQKVGLSAAIVLLLSVGIGTKLVIEAREAHAIAERSRR